MSKPYKFSHAKVSATRPKRVYEICSADAKGPMSVPTPEGYRYFFLIKELYSQVHFHILAKSQANWSTIWPDFVNKGEASLGKEHVFACIISDQHKVHTQASIVSFNAGRGIQTRTSSPYLQQGNPAESGMKVATQMTRTSMIHSGSPAHLWGLGVKNTEQAIGTLRLTNCPPEHKGKCRLQVLYPHLKKDTIIERAHPFLCLVMVNIPNELKTSRLDKPRAVPHLHVYYDAGRKSFLVLSMPHFKPSYRLAVKHIDSVFPLRVSNALNKQLFSWLVPKSDEADQFRRLIGPDNIVRDSPFEQHASGAGLVAVAPTMVRNQVPGPGYSSTRRGYTPSAEGLQSIASAYVTEHGNAEQQHPVFTPDQLASRVPRNTKQALKCEDAEFWEQAILKDHKMMREMQVFKNITKVKPTGKAIGIEQRFRNKHQGDPVSTKDILPKHWKARSICRGDRLEHGSHYARTAAPVSMAPSAKILLAWGVQLGLKPYQADQAHAFYQNPIDHQRHSGQAPAWISPDRRQATLIGRGSTVRGTSEGSPWYPTRLEGAPRGHD